MCHKVVRIAELLGALRYVFLRIAELKVARILVRIAVLNSAAIRIESQDLVRFAELFVGLIGACIWAKEWAWGPFFGPNAVPYFE